MQTDPHIDAEKYVA